jgi:hypothetical protein
MTDRTLIAVWLLAGHCANPDYANTSMENCVDTALDLADLFIAEIKRRESYEQTSPQEEVEILLDALNTGCPCQTIKEQAQCEMGRMLLEAARDALSFALGENPAWGHHLEVVAVLTKANRAHYGMRKPHQPKKER